MGLGIAVDAQGVAYVTGVTASLDFPLATPPQPALRGGFDAFVAELIRMGPCWSMPRIWGQRRRKYAWRAGLWRHCGRYGRGCLHHGQHRLA